LVNEKYFLVKKKFGLVFRKVFSFYFERKTFFKSCEKFRNVMLFADYIKFDTQTFDCYIAMYFVLNLFFFILSIRIWFNLIFISTLILIFMFVICFSFIIFNWNFLSIRFDPHYFDYYFLKNNLWNYNFFLISSFFNFFIC